LSRGATYEVFGELLTAREMALIAGTSINTMCARLAHGMAPEKAIAQPVRASADIVGKTFGQMAVLREVDLSAHRKRQYLCQCACGSPPKVIVGGDLKTGRVVSCGCVFRRKASERAILRGEDLAGRTFANGDVLVLRPMNLQAEKEAGRKKRRWECLCNRCGNTFAALANNLKAGFTTSCGCRKIAATKKRLADLTPRHQYYGVSLTMKEISEVSGVAVATILYRMRTFNMSAEEASMTKALRTQPQVGA
jgi:hypothetical protein